MFVLIFIVRMCSQTSDPWIPCILTLTQLTHAEQRRGQLAIKKKEQQSSWKKVSSAMILIGNRLWDTDFSNPNELFGH